MRFCHANKLRKHKQRAEQWRGGTQGWLTKCQGSERRIKELKTMQLLLEQWLRLRTLFSGGGREEKTVTAPHCERFTSFLSCENNYLPEKKKATEPARVFQKNVAANFLIVPFVLAFFVTSPPLKPPPAWQACRRGRRRVYFSSRRRVGWRQWEEVSCEWHKIEIRRNSFSHLYVQYPPVWFYLYLLVCACSCLAGLSCRLLFHPFLPLVCAAYGHCDGG